MKVNEFKYRGKKWKYYTNEEMKVMYPTNRYLLLGEISSRVGKIKDMPLLEDDGDTLYVQPLGSYKSKFYKKVGCMWCEEAEGFIDVIKVQWSLIAKYSIIPLVLVIVAVVINTMNNKSNFDPNAMPFESSIKRSENMDESRILVPGYNDWNMLAGTDEVYVALYNPDKNPCNFQFTVVLDETGEVLHETGLIPPGQAVTTVKLPRKFEEGVYPITITIDTTSLESGSQKLNGGEVKTNIIALSE